MAVVIPNLAQRQMEYLSRGVVAVNQGEGKVFVSWRMLGTDQDDIAFNLYRATAGAKPVRLNSAPIADVTFFIDDRADIKNTNVYFVRPVSRKKEQAASRNFTLKAGTPVRQYISIPLQTPTGYTPNDASVGDLDGDGDYEIVLHQTSRGRDNSQAGMTDPPILQAYKLDGTLMWTINPRQEHPRRRALHAVHGLRSRRRWPCGDRLQDCRWNNGWQGKGDRRRKS
jgi:rhamnogalacturonan endolyase